MVADRPARSFGPQRVRARAVVLASTALVVAITAMIFVATTGYLETATVSGARQILVSTPADSSWVSFETHLPDDATGISAQDDAARSLIASRFGGTPVAVDRTISTTPLRAVGTGGTPVADVRMVADPGLAGAATLVAGAWPDESTAATGTAATGGEVDTAVQADAAAILGVSVGDTIVVGSETEPTTVRVIGTWRADNPVDPRFGGDPAPASGRSGAAVGPLLVGEPDLLALPATPSVRWTITPKVDELSLASLAALRSSAEPGGVAEAIRRAGAITVESTTVDGRLFATADRISDVASAAAAVSSIPLALSGVIALITLLQLASLLAESRRDETYMLRARGTSVAQLAGWGSAEAAVVVIPAVIIGGAGGLGITAAIDPSTGLAPSVTQLACAALIAVVAILALSLRGFLAARLASSATGGTVAGLLSTLLPVITVLAAALSTWQLLLYGAGSVSPLAALAPTLGVAAVVLVLGTALGPLAALASRALARVRSLLPGLAARQVARQARVFAVASLVAALATGGVTVASTIAGRIGEVDAETSALSTGSDVRVGLEVQGQVSDGTDPVTALPYAGIDAASGAAVVLSETATVGGDEVELVAISAAGLAEVATSAGGRIDTSALASALAPGSDGAPTALPPTATSLSLRVATGPLLRGAAGGVRVQAWLADAGGAIAKVDLGTAGFSDPELPAAGVTLTGTLPAGTVPWNLLAVDASLVGAPSASPITVSFPKARAGDILLEPGLAATEVSSAKVTGRSMVGSADGPPLGTEPVPVVLSNALSQRAGLPVGEPLDLVLSTGRSIAAIVAATAPRLPGQVTPFGIVADLTSLDAAMIADRGPVIQAAEVWIASPAPEETRRAAALVSRYPARIESRESAAVAPLLDPATRALGADLVGVILIALIAFTATAASLLRSRRDEGIVLSALGVTARGQAALRGSELAAVTLFAVVSGTVAGVVAAVLCSTTLAASAVPGAVDTATAPSFGVAVLPVAIVLVALLVITAGYALVTGRAFALRRPSSPLAGDAG